MTWQPTADGQKLEGHMILRKAVEGHHGDNSGIMGKGTLGEILIIMISCIRVFSLSLSLSLNNQNLGVGICEGCFVFDFVSLPLEVTQPI